MNPIHATVVITTKNRKEDLCRSIASALSQTVSPKVLVVDDGSTDGTYELVRRKFSQVQIHRSETSLGLIVQRNRAARMVETPILVSIDDDAVFSTHTVMEATLHEFNHPRVKAVAIPFVDINRSPIVRQKAPSANGVYVTNCYIGTAHALRRDLFLALGGYREYLFHQGEEEDYCVRMLDAGYITRCGSSDPILHFESPRRSHARVDYYGARNKVLYSWANVPCPQVAGHLAVTTLKTIFYNLRPDRLRTRILGVIEAYKLCVVGHVRRQPVSRTAYRLSRLLSARGAVPLEEIEPLLPDPQFG